MKNRTKAERVASNPSVILSLNSTLWDNAKVVTMKMTNSSEGLTDFTARCRPLNGISKNRYAAVSAQNSPINAIAAIACIGQCR